MSLNLYTPKPNWIPNIELEEIAPPARRYPVILHKLNGKFNDPKTGYVVTHLPLSDWCKFNGYVLVEAWENRLARPNEKTELF